MSNYSAPGVYVKEEDQSVYTRGQSTSVAGFIGVASTGPIGTPILVTSLAMFEEKFGLARLDSYLYHGVKDFFEQGGSVAYVVRTAHYTNVATPSTLAAQTSKVTVPLSAANGAAAAVKFSLGYGKFYDGYKVEVISNADNSYDFILRNAQNAILEQHRSILVGLENVGSDRYIESYFPRQSFRGLTAEDMDEAPFAGTYVFAGGNDGLTSLSDSDYIGSASAKTGLYAFNAVRSVRMISAPGLTSPAWIQALITYCENRHNIVPIVATPAGLNPQEAMNFRYGAGAYSHSAFNSNYAAMYWPWIKRLDPATRQVRPIPPEGTTAGLYAYNDFVGWPWTAPAGKNRAKVKNALGVEYSADEAENGELYNAQINVYRNFPESGVVLWGQKTLTDKPSAFDRINVRRLFIYVEDALKEASDYLVFDPNIEETWNQFIRLARPVLQDVQSKGGIYTEGGEPGFLIKCDATTNTPLYRERNTVRALIFIRPTKAAEFIELVFVATGQDTGSGFENLNDVA